MKNDISNLSNETKESRVNSDTKINLAIGVYIIICIVAITLPIYHVISSFNEQRAMKEESRVTAIVEHLDITDTSQVIVQSQSSGTYLITFNGEQYKAQFDYDKEGKASITNFSLVMRMSDEANND
ncbi:hypothetical protein MKY91_20605 [Alkalicoccobacillus gibsonii]|uniref:DUF3139 domain-containing protein n=1 Tax=Alkalicoccobacillus gibsonii TaxID=79881 RepID=A0ABU9VPC0_9BACI